jgi:hypothetical protein
MLTFNTILCFKCEKLLDNEHYKSGNKYVYVHPMGGLHFQSHGHYGSTVFDPMDGSSIDIAICDECLKQHKNKIYGEGKTKERFG